jgi:ABC-2 type transport system permease protein
VSGVPIGVELRTVRGPSALGGGGRRFLELLYLISVTEFKKTYFGTVLGYVWSLLRPLMLYAVLLFVFTQIFRIGSNVTNYPVMLLFNIVLFSFFQEATIQSVTSVVGQETIVRKTQFPRLVIPMATVLTAAFNLGMNMIAVAIFILAFGVTPVTTWLLFPVILLALFALTATLSMMLSTLYVRFRDVAIIWTVAATTLFYATPILYPFEPEIVPEKFHDIMLVNPLTILFIQARQWIIDPAAPNAVELAGGWLQLLPAGAVFALVCFLGVWIFNREAPRVAEEL